jgi:hypothetical protein
VRTRIARVFLDVKDGSCLGIDNLVGPICKRIPDTSGREFVSQIVEKPNLGRVLCPRLKSNRWAVGMKVK